MYILPSPIYYQFVDPHDAVHMLGVRFVGLPLGSRFPLLTSTLVVIAFAISGHHMGDSQRRMGTNAFGLHKFGNMGYQGVPMAPGINSCISSRSPAVFDCLATNAHDPSATR